MQNYSILNPALGPSVSVFTTWLGQVGSPLVLPLLSVEGSGMVVGEWDSETMANLFFYYFSSKILKSHVFWKIVMFYCAPVKHDYFPKNMTFY